MAQCIGIGQQHGDGQGVGENAMALWACAVAQATITVHSAGWLEGGLSFGFEKFIQDMENVQILADMAVNPAPVDDDAIGFDAIAQVEPGGHFFATDQTMKSFETAHYKPLIQNVTNYENWRDAGSPTSHERAVQKWQDIVNNAPQLPHVETLLPLARSLSAGQRRAVVSRWTNPKANLLVPQRHG